MKLELHFRNYIGHTYTKSLAKLVSINKQMNISPKTGAEKRKIAEQAWLEKNGYPLDYLQTLTAETEERCHWVMESGEIVIPAGRVLCALIDTWTHFSKPLKVKMQKHEIRSYLDMTNLRTGIKVPDWRWTRTALGRDASGNVQATAKRILTNEVIGTIPSYVASDPEMDKEALGPCQPFIARGEMRIDEYATEGFEEQLLILFDYMGQHVGIGCCRDMGFGRFRREGAKLSKAKQAETQKPVKVAQEEDE